MTAKNSVAILGGRFDPPHLGHVQVARELLEKGRFQELWVIPTGYSAYKPAQAVASDRLEMCRLAFGPQTLGELSKKVQILDLEIKRDGSTYTADTLDILREQGRGQGRETFFVLGTDQFENIPHWHAFPRVLGLTHWWVLLRSSETGGTEEVQKLSHFSSKLETPPAGDWGELVVRQGMLSLAPQSKLILARTEAGPVSSTQIRRGIALTGQIPQNTLPEPVREYLKARGLYGS